MLYKVSLRNCHDEEVLISEETYKLITESPVYAFKKMAENLRKHSNGYAFYQKNHPQKDGTYVNEKLYLHTLWIVVKSVWRLLVQMKLQSLLPVATAQDEKVHTSESQ